MYTLHPDVYFSRRLRMHHIADEEDILCWSGKSIREALSFLVENNQVEFKIERDTGDRVYILTIRRA